MTDKPLKDRAEAIVRDLCFKPPEQWLEVITNALLDERAHYADLAKDPDTPDAYRVYEACDLREMIRESIAQRISEDA